MILTTKGKTMANAPGRRRASRLGASLALLLGALLLAGCDESSGVGFDVGLPASYGSVELGLSTTSWSGGPGW